MSSSSTIFHSTAYRNPPHSRSHSNTLNTQYHDACSSTSSTATAIYIDEPAIGTECMDATQLQLQTTKDPATQAIDPTKHTIVSSTTHECVSISVHSNHSNPTAGNSNINNNNNSATLSAVNSHHHHSHAHGPPTPTPQTPRKANRNSGLFSDDYTHYISIPNLNLFKKLYSPHASDYYAMSQFKALMTQDSNHKERRSDCPSEISSIDSRRRKRRLHSSKRSRLQRALSAIVAANAIICSVMTHTVHTIVWTCGKFQKWQKDVQEAPIERKEKYFFVASTLVSTVLFYLLFVCLDYLIKHWFALPLAITEFSFSISYCIAYLSSVVWQHFFNQYFVFALKVSTATSTDALPIDAHHSLNNNDNDFCDSLLRTYLVYGCSLLFTGVIGTALQARFGLADEFVLFVTLPMSGVMNYYLLRYCRSRHRDDSSSHGHSYREYQMVPNHDVHHRQKKKSSRRKHSKSASQIAYSPKKKYFNNAKKSHKHSKHPSAADDIVIV